MRDFITCTVRLELYRALCLMTHAPIETKERHVIWRQMAVIAVASSIVSIARPTIAVDIWLSEIGQVGAGVQVDDRLFSRCAAIDSVVNQEIYLWFQLDTSDPADLAAIDLNVISTDPSIIEFTGATVHNPVSASGNRWELVDEDVNLTTPSEMIGFGGFNLSSGTGLGASGIGSDSQYDSLADAWLTATLTYDIVLTSGSGSTDLFLEIGNNGISGEDALGVPVASSSIDVLFGDDTTSLNAATDRETHVGQNSDGTIEAGDFDGDHNADCSVDLSDLNLVLFNWNQPETMLPPIWINNVPAFPTTVGLIELNAVLFNWGSSYPFVGSPAPEPSSVAMLLIALGFVGHSFWRRSL